jgi:hypothetical protein
MSDGGIIGALVGGVAGFFMGGPIGAVYGASLGYGIGTLIDPMTPDSPSVLGIPDPGETVMTSSVGDPLPIVLGTNRLTGHLLWYGNERTVERTETSQVAGGGKGGGGETTVTRVIGHTHYMTWCLGICTGPVTTLLTVLKNEQDVVWEGELNCPVTGGEETITLEGMGSCTFYFGTSDQAANSTLGGLISDSTLNTPYRNFCWAFLDDCIIGDYPRTPTLSFVVRNQPEYDFSSSNIIQEYDYNPIHAQWHILHTIAGLPVALLNSSAFASAAFTIANEYRGISMQLSTPGEVTSFIQTINSHIDSILKFNSDGTFYPILIRDDYDVDSVVSVDESVLLEEPTFSRNSWIDTVNEVRVQYSEIINVTREEVLSGILYGCGRNDYGEVGDGTASILENFTVSTDTDKFKQIASGSNHSFGLKVDGTIWEWGREWTTPTYTEYHSPHQVGTASNWVAVGCSRNGVFAIEDNGSIWGSNSGGIAGIPTTFSQLTSWGTGWAGIDGGDDWLLAYTSGGLLYGYGKNTFGKFGTGDNVELTSLTMLSLSGVTGISCGQYFTLVNCGGIIWGAGQNSYGQLGQGYFSTYEDEFVSLGSGTATAIGSKSTGILTSAGELYVCGQNLYGQLGVGGTSNVNSLTHVSGGWAKMAQSRAETSIGIKADGTIWGAGNNSYGQIGYTPRVATNEYFVQEDLGYSDWQHISGYVQGTLALR